jgi:hypothetical protein
MHLRVLKEDLANCLRIPVIVGGDSGINVGSDSG